MTQMQVLPWDGGRPVIKSMEMASQVRPGIGSGWSNPAGAELVGLTCKYTEQFFT